MVKDHPSWDMIDSSKIKEYMSCPRSYFFRYILGWDRDNPGRNDLVFGSSWHKGMAFLLENWNDLDSVELVNGAFKEFLTEYRLTFSADTDEMFHPKSPMNALRGLAVYLERYKDDNFTVLHNEISGTVPISPDKIIYFRVDAIVRDNNKKGIVLLEHKTGKRFSQTWADQFSLSTQIGTYLHVVNCLYKPSEVWGGIVSGAFFGRKAEIISDDFVRVPIRKTPDSMAVWFRTTTFWFNRITNETTLFRHRQGKEKDKQVMSLFPMNTESCTKYWGCKYKDFCISWPNPLKRCEITPSGIKVEYWDPLEGERKIKETKVERGATYGA